MIRIDEIYNHTFWPWVQQNLPLTRLFFCDPFGSIDPGDLKNFGSDTIEHNYIFMHDQEPIDLAVHKKLFNVVEYRNTDLRDWLGPKHKAIIVSERDSDHLDAACERYGWTSFYYFFHGWAALDWYRGYDKTFLIVPPDARQITHSFLSLNRIIGGKRNHRLLLLYHLLKQGVVSALISCPLICPGENKSVQEILQPYSKLYPDIVDQFEGAGLPWHLGQEHGHPMTSCWLDLFQESSSSLVYVVTETVFFGRRLHVTEKIFKPICLYMPFVVASSKGTLAYLRSYGFRTFGDFWDESYDEESDDLIRLEKIAKLLVDLDRLTDQEKQKLFETAIPVIKHNYDHFYGGGFEKILWQEFQQMLSDIHRFCTTP